MKLFNKYVWPLLYSLLRAMDLVLGPPKLVHATAATADRNITSIKETDLVAYPVYTGVTIYKGTMVCLNSSGYAVPAADTSGYSKVIGVAYEQVVAGAGASGTYNIRVRANCIAPFIATSITQAMVGAVMYVVDDSTFDDASISNSIQAGTLVKFVDSTHGYLAINNVAVPAVPTGSVSGTMTVTSASANALAVGRLGATTPAFNVDASAGTQVTGFNVAAQASGAGLNLSVIGGGAAEALKIDAKGSGTVSIATVSTGAITLGAATGITSVSASALAVGRQGATNPVLQVDASTATVLTGVLIKGAGTGAGAAISVVESGGTNNALKIDAMGSGIVNIGATSTGIVVLGRGATSAPVYGGATVSLGTQNITPTIAQLLNGYIVHTSTTGAGTFTTPTGANISAGIPNVAVGDHFRCMYSNIGNQTVTITAGDGNVTFPATQIVAIPTHRNCILDFYNISAGVWQVIITLGAAS